MRQWQPWHLLPPGKSLAILFRVREHDVFARLWCHLTGIPPKLGIPHDFGQFCLVKCITITKLNVTIPVLFKTSIKAFPHPPSPPPPHPIIATPPQLHILIHSNMCAAVTSTIKFHWKSFLKETFESFLKRPPLKETLRQKKFP